MNTFNRVSLRHVVGNTVVRSAGMASNRRTREIAYLAGGVIVVCDPSTGRQTRFLAPLDRLVTAKPRGLSCLAFSRDGTVLASGERGRYPCVHVWTGYNSAASGHHEAHHYLRGEHRSGISCLAISPCNRYLVSVGGRGDCIVLWSLDNDTVLFKQALERNNLIHCVAFAQDGSFFVTAGPRNLCYWSILFTASAATISPMPVSLPGVHGEAVFIDVACGSDGRVFAAAHSRILYVFDRSCHMTRWVNLNTKIYALALSSSCLACACANGTVYLFDPDTLACHGMLPRPHPLGVTVVGGSISGPLNTSSTAAAPARYPDVVSCVLVQDNDSGDGSDKLSSVVCAYSDKSLHFWPINDDNTRTLIHNAFVAHSKAVVDIALVPNNLGKAMFATTSSDGTLRFLALGDSGAETLHLIPQSATVAKSEHLNNSDDYDNYNISNGNDDDGDDEMNGINEICTHQVVPSYDYLDFSQQSTILAGSDEHGARSLATRADGRHLALGGRRGQLYVIDIPSLQPIVDIASAHTAEIVSLDYSRPANPKGILPHFLATCSNDARIHVFYAGDANGPTVPYKRIHTINNRRTPVTSVKFFSGTRLLACSVSGSVIAAEIAIPENGNNSFTVSTLYNVKLPLAVGPVGGCQSNDLDVSVYAGVNSNDCVFSLSVDPTLQHAVIGTSSEIYVISTVTGRAEVSHKADEDMYCFAGDDDSSSGGYDSSAAAAAAATITARNLLSSVGPLVKVEIDPAGMFFATSNGDKIVRLYDLHTGVIMEKIAGHADFVSALKFTPDCKQLITASADSCVFVWDISPSIVAGMTARMTELSIPEPQNALVPAPESCDFEQLLGLKTNAEGEQKVCEDGADEWMASTDVTMVPARVWDDNGASDSDDANNNDINDGDISVILKSRKEEGGNNSDSESDSDDDDVILRKDDERSLLEATLRSLKTPPSQSKKRGRDATTAMTVEKKKQETESGNGKITSESIEKAQDAVDKLLQLAKDARGTNYEDVITNALRSIQSDISDKFK